MYLPGFDSIFVRNSCIFDEDRIETGQIYLLWWRYLFSFILFLYLSKIVYMCVSVMKVQWSFFILEWPYTTRELLWNESNLWRGCPLYDCYRLASPVYNYNSYRRLFESAPIPGRPQTTIEEDSIHQVETAILEDRHVNVRQLALDVKNSVEDLWTNLFTAVCICKIVCSVVPRLYYSCIKKKKKKTTLTD